MSETLEERLKSHAQAFDGLLSLIPAKYYYGEDTSDQWKRKKQTKEQAKAAKIAKLNPDNAKSAKDVLDEQARKRKREEDGDLLDVEGITVERPKEGMKPAPKKQKKEKLGVGNNHAEGEEADASEKTKAEKLREERKEKAEVKKAKKHARQEKKVSQAAEKKAATQSMLEDGEDSNDESEEHAEPVAFDGINRSEKQSSPASETSGPSKAPSPSFDISNNTSGTSSISSIATQNLQSSENKSKRPKLEVKIGQDELRARLQKRIAELRAARKADNEDGTPARTRTELIEERRKKADEKKANKKALRQQAKEEERRQKEEALARGSPLLSPSGMSPAHVSSPLSEPANNFSFGKVAFNNGQSMTASLDAVLDTKKKGPQDPQTALLAARKRDQRLSGLDAEKHADIEEKDMWLNARKRAQGERPRDDTSLLKKALKRKENKKKKSGKEWTDRLAGVAQSQIARQRKRTENLQKRKEEKGTKGKKGGSKKPKKKARPGFEGSFRARGKGR